MWNPGSGDVSKDTIPNPFTTLSEKGVLHNPIVFSKVSSLKWNVPGVDRAKRGRKVTGYHDKSRRALKNFKVRPGKVWCWVGRTSR